MQGQEGGDEGNQHLAILYLFADVDIAQICASPSDV
jgi:hypothetical protein